MPDGLRLKSYENLSPCNKTRRLVGLARNLLIVFSELSCAARWFGDSSLPNILRCMLLHASSPGPFQSFQQSPMCTSRVPQGSLSCLDRSIGGRETQTWAIYRMIRLFVLNQQRVTEHLAQTTGVNVKEIFSSLKRSYNGIQSSINFGSLSSALRICCRG